MIDEVLIVDNLFVYAPTIVKGKNARLIDNISFTLEHNDVLGLVGETGSGKSVLINAIGCNNTPPLWSEADRLLLSIDDRQANLLEMEEEELRGMWGKDIAFIPTNARDRLNPILKVGKQVSNIIQSTFKLSPDESRKKVLEVFKAVQMPDPEQNFNSYPHELSGGMAQRILISITLSLSPRLLLADEPTMGLDLTIQTQVLDLMAKFIRKLQAIVLLATRDLGIVAHYCNKVGVLCEGQMMEFAGVKDFFKNAKHPYSKYLLAAAFASHHKIPDFSAAVVKDKMYRQGDEQRSEDGCHFANRCPLASEICWLAKPSTNFLNKNHFLACHNWKET